MQKRFPAHYLLHSLLRGFDESFRSIDKLLIISDKTFVQDTKCMKKKFLLSSPADKLSASHVKLAKD